MSAVTFSRRLAQQLTNKGSFVASYATGKLHVVLTSICLSCTLNNTTGIFNDL